MPAPEVGSRIELVVMGLDPNGRPDPDPIPAGARGTVDWVSDTTSLTRRPSYQLGVKWDPPHEHRSLMLVCPPDRYRVLMGPTEGAGT